MNDMREQIKVLILMGFVGFMWGVTICSWGSSDSPGHAADPESPCLEKMETAMRAREKWAELIEEKNQWITVYNAPTITHGNITFGCCYGDSMQLQTYQPDRRTDEERLADEQKALDEKKIALAKRREEQRIEAEKKQEKAGRLIVLKAQWEQAKACWRKP